MQPPGVLTQQHRENSLGLHHMCRRSACARTWDSTRISLFASEHRPAKPNTGILEPLSTDLCLQHGLKHLRSNRVWCSRCLETLGNPLLLAGVLFRQAAVCLPRSIRRAFMGVFWQNLRYGLRILAK